MKAISQTRYGSPDVLTVVDAPTPALTPFGVMVEVYAVAVTQGDRRLRSADFPGMTWLPGLLAMGITGPRSPVPGTMFAGRVIAVGPRVTQWTPGDDVFGSVDHGAMAEYLVVEEGGIIAALPDGFTHAEAAALPYGAVTALEFLENMAEVKPGQHVCILGASGGVGRYAIQVAKHLGAEVTAVCSAAQHPLVQSLGADHVVDRRTQDYRRMGHTYDVIFDTTGSASFTSSRTALTPRGRFLTVYMTMVVLFDMVRTQWTGGQRAMFGLALGSAEIIERVRALAAQGVLRPNIVRSYPFTDSRAAHAALDRGDLRGEVVVEIRSAARASFAA